MMDTEEHKTPTQNPEYRDSEKRWGPKLFWVMLLVILVFFWWLLIYSHGIETKHG
ncbi:MAG: hypothetical protein L3J84_04085 [Gammaproteobacteria bacterium]|nr:hypothetical protein [Gammaproteobacteria bacterium]